MTLSDLEWLSEIFSDIARSLCDSWASCSLRCSYSALDVRRKNASRESTGTLKAWLHQHIKNPYPTKAEKVMLAIITKMTLTQVSTWFANARRRIKKDNRTHGPSTHDTSKTESDDEDDIDSVVMETRRNDIRLANDNSDVVVNVGKKSGSRDVRYCDYSCCHETFWIEEQWPLNSLGGSTMQCGPVARPAGRGSMCLASLIKPPLATERAT